MYLNVISIHAPAKGATIQELLDDDLITISIHAPAKGATLNLFQQESDEFNFNPRSREGSDEISSSSFDLVFNFNPRSREGSDLRPSHLD